MACVWPRETKWLDQLSNCQIPSCISLAENSWMQAEKWSASHCVLLLFPIIFTVKDGDGSVPCDWLKAPIFRCSTFQLCFKVKPGKTECVCVLSSHEQTADIYWHFWQQVYLRESYQEMNFCHSFSCPLSVMTASWTHRSHSLMWTYLPQCRKHRHTTNIPAAMFDFCSLKATVWKTLLASETSTGFVHSLL